MKKKVLALILALALCLGLTVPALAAGTTKVVTDELHGVTVTMDGFLREETHRYLYSVGYAGYKQITFYVVEDNSTVTVAAMEGRGYDATEVDGYMSFDRDALAWAADRVLLWQGEWGFTDAYDMHYPHPLSGPETVTMAPTDMEGDFMSMMVDDNYNVHVICESDYAKLIPFEGAPLAADWAQETLADAYDAGLFPEQANPFDNDCTQDMTRAQFAAVAANLFDAMGGTTDDRSYVLPFTDVTGRDSGVIGYAYNLGLVNGTSATTFSPDATLTREQAAVMLSRVYAKLHGDIPQVTATPFADDASVASWAKSGVAFMAEKGIVSGVGDNKFAPQQTLSIQEAVVMAQRMLEKLK